MENNQTQEVVLTYTDKTIIALLKDVERYQEDLLNIPIEAIKDTVEKLETTSSEFLAGLNILTYRAEAETSDALVEIDEEVDDEIIPIIPLVITPPGAVDDELWDRIFGIERDLDQAASETTAAIDRLAEEVKESNESTFQKIGQWLSDFEDDLHSTLWGWIPELTNNAAIYLASLPARLLFESFKNFFFEEG